MNKLPQYIAYITILTALGLMLLVSYWLLHKYTPITFNSLPLKVENKTVKAGDFLTYTVDYCKYNDLIPVATKSFVDQIIYIVPAEIVVAKSIGCAVVNVQMVVPPNLPPSTYLLKITYRYQINPIKTIDINVESEPFIVTK